MTPERIAELRTTSEGVLNGQVLINGTRVYDMARRMIEMANEIERLRGWLETIDALSHDAHDWIEHSMLEHVNIAVHGALNGDEVPS